MELGLYPKRQMIYREVHPSHAATRRKQQPNNTSAWWASGHSIWRKLLLMAAYENICHVTGRSRATDHYQLDGSGFFMRRGLRCCCVNVSSNVCVRRSRSKLTYMLMVLFHYCQYHLILFPDTDKHIPEGHWSCILYNQWVYVDAYLVHEHLHVCMHVFSRSEQLRVVSWIRIARVSVGIRFSEVSGLPSSIFYSILLFGVREKPGMGEEGVKEEGRNMIHPSRDLMNLLWLAKLFMSLIAKFLHASLPFSRLGSQI